MYKSICIKDAVHGFRHCTLWTWLAYWPRCPPSLSPSFFVPSSTEGTSSSLTYILPVTRLPSFQNTPRSDPTFLHRIPLLLGLTPAHPYQLFGKCRLFPTFAWRHDPLKFFPNFRICIRTDLATVDPLGTWLIFFAVVVPLTDLISGWRTLIFMVSCSIRCTQSNS